MSRQKDDATGHVIIHVDNRLRRLENEIFRLRVDIDTLAIALSRLLNRGKSGKSHTKKPEASDVQN